MIPYFHMHFHNNLGSIDSYQKRHKFHCCMMLHYKVQMAKNLLDNDKYQDYYQQVLKTMTFTSFWVHIESILLAMVMDTDPKVNAKAVKMIDTIRKKRKNAVKVRKFLKPKADEIDFNAPNYYSMIKLDSYKPRHYCSPPLLNKFSIEDIKAKNFGNGGFLSVPCHSQAVERYVYLTSKAAESVVGQDKRHQKLINNDVQAAKVPKGASKILHAHLVQKELEGT